MRATRALDLPPGILRAAFAPHPRLIGHRELRLHVAELFLRQPRQLLLLRREFLLPAWPPGPDAWSRTGPPLSTVSARPEFPPPAFRAARHPPASGAQPPARPRSASTPPAPRGPRPWRPRRLPASAPPAGAGRRAGSRRRGRLEGRLASAQTPFGQLLRMVLAKNVESTDTTARELHARGAHRPALLPPCSDMVSCSVNTSTRTPCSGIRRGAWPKAAGP